MTQSRRIPVLISRLEYRRREADIVWKSRRKQLNQDREHHHISTDLCDGFECIHDTTVEVITG